VRSIASYSTAPLFASIEPGQRVVRRVASAPSAAVVGVEPRSETHVVRDAAWKAGEVERLYREHRDLVYRLALRYGSGRRAWAEDITQDVFLALFDVIATLTDRHDMGGFLYRATTNRCLSKLRRDRFLSLPPIRWLLGERAPDSYAPEAGLEARDDLRLLLTTLDSLSPKERIAFSMYYVDGLEQDAIGAVLGHSKGYVCKLIQRAVAGLRAAGWEVRDGHE
jgi:RNA polymerase sigma-70 factor (ECF subfamily)